jgi:hypothetical protein
MKSEAKKINKKSLTKKFVRTFCIKTVILVWYFGLALWLGSWTGLTCGCSLQFCCGLHLGFQLSRDPVLQTMGFLI